MKAFVEKIQALFAEQPDQVAAALAEVGYIPKPAAGTGAENNLTPEALLESEPVKAKVAAATAEGVAALKAYVIAIMEMCALGGASETLAIGFIAAGTSLEDARTKIMADKAAAAGRTHITSTVGALSTGQVNPLKADAEKRAAGK